MARAQVWLAGWLLVGVGAVGCSSAFAVGGGEYTLVRIASQDAVAISGDCANNDGDTTDLFSGGTFLVYGVAGEDGERIFLDTGDTVYEGAVGEDDLYQFTGRTKDVDGVSITNTAVTINLTPDGNSVSGDYAIAIDVTCNSGDSDLCQGVAFKCNIAGQFVGVILDHETDASPGSPIGAP